MHKMLPHGLVSMDRVSALLTNPQEENPENSTQDVQIQPPPGPQELMDTDMQKRVSTSGPHLPPREAKEGPGDAAVPKLRFLQSLTKAWSNWHIARPRCLLPLQMCFHPQIRRVALNSHPAQSEAKDSTGNPSQLFPSAGELPGTASTVQQCHRRQQTTCSELHH